MTPDVSDDTTCDCLSYNGRFGLTPPARLPWPFDDSHPNGIDVDACIARPVKALWEAGLPTLASCCGHGGRFAAQPSVVLADGVNSAAAHDVLAAADNRDWLVQQWRLVVLDRVDPCEEEEPRG